MNRIQYSRPLAPIRGQRSPDPILLTPRESLALMTIGLEPDDVPHSAIRTPHLSDSQTLSEIVRIEKRRAKLLAISIIVLLIVAVCLQLLQS